MTPRPTPMTRVRHALVTLLVTALAGSLAAPAAADTTPPAPPNQVFLFVIDLSGSMNEAFDGNRTKLDVAKDAFVEAFARVPDDALVGLRVYGDTIEAAPPGSREEGCTQDSRLVVPPGALDRDELINEVQGFTELGDTPIALALRQADGDIPDDAIGTVVLFSDGRDECFDADLDGEPSVGPSYGEDPCVVAADIAGEGVDLRIDRVETVGFGADAAAETELRCIADATGGSYTPIETPEDAREVLPDLLAELANPRTPERLGGTPIVGTPTEDGAPTFTRRDTPEAHDGRWTDTIAMGSEKWYRVEQYGPGAVTMTFTAFGVPAQPGITASLRAVIAETGQELDMRSDDDFGLPRAPTQSLRCPGCTISPDGEVFLVLSLATDNPDLGGEYDLEILLEGAGIGGPPVQCTEPQACWYEGQVATLTDDVDAAQEEVDALVGEFVDPELVERRDALRTELEARDADQEAAAQDLEALQLQQAAFGDQSSPLGLPIGLALLGLLAGGGALLLGRRRDGHGGPDDPGGPTAAPAATDGEFGIVLPDEPEAPPTPPPAPPAPTPHEAPAPTPHEAPASEPTPTPSAEAVPPSDDTPTVLPDDTPTPEAAPLEIPEGQEGGAPPPTPPPPSGPPPGWYPTDDPDVVRWWDGTAWTDDARSRTDGTMEDPS